MKILLLFHWFPPTNIIGSVRAFQIARHLTDAGHDVRVICAAGSRFPADYQPDMQGIACYGVDSGPLIRWLEPAQGNDRFRLLRALVRRMFFPDHYVVLQRRYLAEAKKLFRSGFQPDMIVSSALPFSIHLAALRIKILTSACWLADNRDLWASSPYRRRLPLLRRLDHVYERHVLSKADKVLAIGRNMARDLQARLGSKFKVVVIRNGADSLGTGLPVRRRSAGEPLRFIYTGILYGGVRDIRPLFEALRKTGDNAQVDFFRSESRVVEAYQRSYPDISIQLHDQVSKDKVKQVQRKADFLVVALGTSDFEKGVLTGKVFEYIESRRPIIALCDEDSELGCMVREHGLGIASRNAQLIGEFIKAQVQNGVPDLPVPHESLSRKYQLDLLESCMRELRNEK